MRQKIGGAAAASQAISGDGRRSSLVVVVIAAVLDVVSPARPCLAGVAVEGKGAEVELASTSGANGLMPSEMQQHVRPR